MLSIIICSINPTLLNQLSENIESKVGVDYEIIAHDNRETNWGICKVYNHCAEKAKYDYLVFCHEDILFHTENWGQNLVNHLKNKEIGLVGIAGGIFKSKFHSSWWLSTDTINLKRINIRQTAKNKSSLDYYNPENETYSDVVAIDGVFMACRKDIWKKNNYDEATFPKFHFYDLDFSFQIIQNKKIVVVYDILLEHFSVGSYNSDWIVAAEKFTEKWKKKLPASTINIDIETKKQLEKKAKIFFIISLIYQNLKFKILKYYSCFLICYPFNKNHKNLIYRILKLFLPKK